MAQDQGAPMRGQPLDTPTRIGVVATVVAVLGLAIPPIAVASALVAIIFSAVGWRRASALGDARPLARTCLLASAGLITFLVVGNLVYAAG